MADNSIQGHVAAAGLDTCGHVHQMWRLVSAAPGDRGYGGTSALLLAAAGHLAHYKHRHHDQDLTRIET